METKKDDSFLDNLKELINGGYIMLFLFGTTICLMATTSLICAAFAKDQSKITLFSKVFDTLIGFIAGAYTTMWNNQHFKTENKNGGTEKKEIIK